MCKMLNTCPKVVSYIAKITEELQQHQQKNQKNEYKMIPVSCLLDELKRCGIGMNVRLTSAIVPRSTFI